MGLLAQTAVAAAMTPAALSHAVPGEYLHALLVGALGWRDADGERLLQLVSV
jgi:hypothetical protein